MQYQKNRYSNANKEELMCDFGKFVPRDKVSFIGKIFRQDAIDEEKRLDKAIDRQRMIMDFEAQQRQEMGNDKYEQMQQQAMDISLCNKKEYVKQLHQLIPEFRETDTSSTVIRNGLDTVKREIDMINISNINFSKFEEYL